MHNITVIRSASSLVLLLFFCIAAHAQNAPASGSLTKQGILKDLDIYKNGIADHHIDPFSDISREQFSQELANIRDDAPNLNAEEMLVALMTVNARIQDEHTNIEFRENTLFPFFCYWFQNDIVITKCDILYQSCQYAKLISVGNVPISDAIKRLSVLLPDKNENAVKLKMPNLLCSPTLLYGTGITNNKDSVVLTLINSANDTITTSIAAKEKNAIISTKYRPQQMPLRYSKKKNYWFQYIPESNYIYFNYSKCTEDPSYPFSDFQAAFFEELKSKDPSKIIIDLRDNGGGNEHILFPFIDELSKSGLNKPHGIYVLIGRRTFSSALLNVLDIADKMPITTIGESTSGSINHYGEIQSFQLTDCGLTVTYSTKYFRRKENKDGPLEPDISIPETLSDFIMGNDAALDYAVSH
jgi:hypothetical protein